MSRFGGGPLRYWLSILLLLACASGSHEQGVKIAGPVKVAGPVTFGGTSTCSPSDTFSGSGALSANWTSPETNFGSQTLTQSSGVAINASTFGTGGWALWTGCTMPNNQYAQATATAVPAYFVGLLVRATSSGNGYDYVIQSASSSISKCAAGTCTFAANCPNYSVGHVYKLDVQGSSPAVITCYDVTASTSGTYSDSSSPYTSGAIGMVIENGASGGTSGNELASFSGGTP